MGGARPPRFVGNILPVNYIQVERNIQMAPAWRSALQAWERFIEDTSQPDMSADRVEGGTPEYFQDRVMRKKEHCREYQRLCRNCEIIDSAMARLNRQEQEFITLFFWNDLQTDTYSHGAAVALRMGFCERTVWRWRDRLLRKLEPDLREIDPTVFLG